MTECRECRDEVEELVRVKVPGSKAVKVCEDCADRMREEAEIAERLARWREQRDR